jgi:hypothetical protein
VSRTGHQFIEVVPGFRQGKAERHTQTLR